ncbi:MAG TPA: hypothetical protein VM901_09715 [Bdellovibrionota bacterium]|nr:hypothetical protein [Bdellovibrionota bacterium]
MNPMIYCLSILPVTAPTTAAPPPPVIEIVQRHVVHEIKRVSPLLNVNFGVASCPNIIHFEESAGALHLSGETATWSGEAEIVYTDALAERPLDLSPYLRIPSPSATALGTPSPSSSGWKRWLLWSGVGLIAGGAVYYLAQKNGNANPSASEGVALKQGVKF